MSSVEQNGGVDNFKLLSLQRNIKITIKSHENQLCKNSEK